MPSIDSIREELSALQSNKSRYVILTGDSVKLLDSESGLSDVLQADHLICDPPFEVQAHTKGRRVRRSSLPGGERLIQLEPLLFEPMSVKGRVNLGRYIRNSVKRWSLVFCQIEAAMIWRQAIELDASKVVYKRTCVWIKPDGQPQITGDRPAMPGEHISLHIAADQDPDDMPVEWLVLHHRIGRSKWNGGGRLGYFVHNKFNNARNKSTHQTQKPLALMMQLVELFTNEGDIVIDPYCGSGSTGVACMVLGRRFIGIELNQDTAQEAKDRCQAAVLNVDYSAYKVGQQPLFAEAT